MRRARAQGEQKSVRRARRTYNKWDFMRNTHIFINSKKKGFFSGVFAKDLCMLLVEKKHQLLL